MRDRLCPAPAPSLVTAVTTLVAGLAVAATLIVRPAPALAQGGGMGATPLAVDLKKVPLGSWAEYKLTFGDQPAKARWALVGRKPDSVIIEMIMEGGPAAAMGGGKTTARLVMAPDPTKTDHAVKQMVVQMEGQDPMEMPTQGANQKFERPDPKKLVGKETVTVPAGNLPTSHYRNNDEHGNIDMWISESVPPLGLVKFSFTPKAGAPMPPVTMELSGKGKDAKPTITKAPKPFDPALLMGMRGGAHGGAAPGGPPHQLGAPPAPPVPPPPAPVAPPPAPGHP